MMAVADDGAVAKQQRKTRLRSFALMLGIHPSIH
jgi:hypothetical protein